MLERIDHIVCVVPDLAATGAAYERLGLALTPEARYGEIGVANRALFVGGNPANFTYLELLMVTDAGQAARTGREAYVEAANRGGGAVGLVFGVDEIGVATARLTSAGFSAPVETVHRADGSKVLDTATVDTQGRIPFRTSIAQYPESREERFERSADAGRFAHSFPLKRLDHLAAVAPDLDAACKAWEEILDVSVAGEIRTPQLIIRQLKIGDAILELLGPASPDSPMASRPAGLASVAAWEVQGRLDDAVTLARERGFTVSDAETGVIPHTRRAAIPAGEAGGISMQLLEYV